MTLFTAGVALSDRIVVTGGANFVGFVCESERNFVAIPAADMTLMLIGFMPIQANGRAAQRLGGIGANHGNRCSPPTPPLGLHHREDCKVNLKKFVQVGTITLSENSTPVPFREVEL